MRDKLSEEKDGKNISFRFFIFLKNEREIYLFCSDFCKAQDHENKPSVLNIIFKIYSNSEDIMSQFVFQKEC